MMYQKVFQGRQEWLPELHQSHVLISVAVLVVGLIVAKVYCKRLRVVDVPSKTCVDVPANVNGLANKKRHTHMEDFASRLSRGNGSSRSPHQDPILTLLPSSIYARGSSFNSFHSPGSESSSVSSVNVAKRLFNSSDSPPQENMRERILEESTKNPKVLVGCRIFISGKGQGVITGTQKNRLRSTLYKIIFDNQPTKEVIMKLQRGPGKPGERFQLISYSER